MKSLTHCFVSRVLFIGILVVWANQLSTSGANTISGEQSDTRNGPWTLDRSPYVVVDDITVPEGETLTIEAGVEVRFECIGMRGICRRIVEIYTPHGHRQIGRK